MHFLWTRYESEKRNFIRRTTIFSLETTNLAEQRDEHRVHLIAYHLIWCPKRRKAVLVGKIKVRGEELLRKKGEEKGWDVLELAIQPDHIPLFVRVWPTESAAFVTKELKGITAFYLRQEFKPTLSKLPSLWTRSYVAWTVGQVSADTIRASLEAQKGGEDALLHGATCPPWKNQATGCSRPCGGAGVHTHARLLLAYGSTPGDLAQSQASHETHPY